MVTWFQQEAVTNAMEDEVVTGKALPIHVVDICIEVSEYAETVDPQFQRTSEVYSWIISWGTGHHSFGMARLLSLLKRTKLFLSFSTIKHPFICNGNVVSTGSGNKQKMRLCV
jgi:hypothetical protein